MFSKPDLKTDTIDGQKYVTFHPNTIIYAVPYDQADALRKAKIGIVWHTTYKGKDFESMKATYGVDVSKFKSSVNIWSQDAMLRDVSGATMDKKETAEVTKHLSTAGKIFNKIAGSTLRELERNQDLAQLIEQYNNTFVRAQTVDAPGGVPRRPCCRFWAGIWHCCHFPMRRICRFLQEGVHRTVK